MNKNFIIIPVLFFLGCSEDKEETKFKTLNAYGNCKYIGWWKGNPKVDNRLGYRCSDSLEYRNLLLK